MPNVGDKVKLRCNCGYGSLSCLSLYEHLLLDTDEPVEVVGVKVDNYDYQVKLPDGYLLKVDNKDIRL